MKKFYITNFAISCLVFTTLLTPLTNLQAQCVNADFSDGNFTGWTGTYSAGQCTGLMVLGICAGCSATNPLNAVGFNQGPNNDPPTDATTEYSHVLVTTAGGNDPYLTSVGATLPMVWPGGASTYSCRLGCMWQAVSSAGTGDGETLSYTFVVTPTNCNFTYHYAAIVNAGQGHTNAEQPYFSIRMFAAGGDTIDCATYDVNANDAATIGGFNIIADPNYGNVYWKPWASVFIPLNNYMGQTVTITFTSRGCLPSLCAGSHFAYEYISAECAPLALVASTPTVCGGQDLTLTAPQGAATYSWTGPGIVGGANSQVVTIDQPGEYVVAMTTFGNEPCDFSLDTFMAGNPANPIASFAAPTVCSGSPTTFTDQSSPHASLSYWSWNFGDGDTSNAENPTHTFATTGTYPVTLTVTSTPCTKDTVINVTVSPPPTSTFTATSPVCEGTNSNVVYTGNAPVGDTYTWNFDGGTAVPNTGQGPLNVSWATGGTKAITLTVSAGSCSSTSVDSVVVDPFPGMTLTPYTIICSGQTATLTASGATTYSWAADPSINSGSLTAPGITATPTNTTTYSVTGTSTNCTAVDTVTVAVYPVPTSTFTVVSPVCVGQNSAVNYTGNAGVAATYNWTFGGGTANPGGTTQGPDSVSWASAGTNNITLTVTQFGCTSTLTSLPVTVNPNPTSTFTTTSPLCLGQNSTITYTGNGDAQAAYTWGFSGGTVISGANGGPYTINWASTGTYNVTLSVTDNGCSSPVTTVPVTINAIPTANFMAASPVCTGAPSAVAYTGTASTAATYAWNFGTGTSTPASTSIQGPFTVIWSNGGVQSIILNVTENGCVAPPDTVQVTVNPSPTSTFTASGPVCVGQASAVNYTGNGDNTATYNWNFGTGTANPGGTTAGPDSVTWSAAGTQTISLTVTENGCTSQPSTQSVIVNAIPTAIFNASSPLCSGQTGTVTYTGSSDNAAQFNWSFSGATVTGGGVNSRGPFTVSWSTDSVVTETISLAVSDNGCIATPVSVPVTINPIPASDAGIAPTYCSGGSAVIGAAATPGYTYAWVPATGLSDATSSNPTVSLTTAPDNITTQIYTVTTTSLGCFSTATVTVTVNPVPAPQLTAPAAQCLSGNQFVFKVQGSFLNSASFSWTFGAGATPATSTASTQVVTYTSAGTSEISLTVSQAGCSDSASTTAVINPEPQPAFKPDSVIGCQNFEVCFGDSSTGAGLTYAWNFGDGETSSDPSPCHLYVAPGVYAVSLKVVSSQNCTYDTVMPHLIEVIADPVAKFTPSVSVLQQPQSLVDFTNQSLNAATYLWNFNMAGVSDASIGNSTDVNPQFNFTQYGLYTVKLTAYNELKCADSTQLPITVLPPQNIYIPNAFTPNGDGNNDEFFVDLQEGATLISLKIFNRWGEKVHDGLYPWDGTYMGKKSPEGVYVYEANIHLIDQNIDIERRGSVTLIR